MRRILISLLLMFTAAVTWAQRWTVTNANAYPDETIVYLQVNLNGTTATDNDGLEVAAFIDGECRAAQTSQYSPASGGGPENSYLLRVRGKSGTDDGKTITFKAYYEGVVYKFDYTTTWSQETVSDIPVKVELSTLVGISRDYTVGTDDNPINVSLPGTYDMSGLATLLFGADQVEESQVTGSSVDTDETEIAMQWEAGNSEAYLEIDENGLLTAKEETESAWVGMNVVVKDKVQIDATTGNPSVTNHRSIDPQGFIVRIARPVVPVTSITCDIQELTVYRKQDVRSALDQHITISPDDATDKTWYIVDNNRLVSQDVANEAGETTIFIYPTTPASDDVAPAEVKLTIKIRPTDISADPTTVDVELGDNVIDAIKGVITLRPTGEYVDDELTITPADATLYNSQTGIATKVGTTTVTVTPTNAETAQVAAPPSVTITLNVKKSVAAIALEAGEITVYRGDNVKDAIADRVTITPDDATEKKFELVEVAETLLISQDIAAQSGVTTVKVRSVDNQQLVSDNSVTVNIKERPTRISVSPAEITVNIGDNVYDAIEAIVTLEPNVTYLDRSLTLNAGNAALYDANFIANQVGTMTVTVTPTAAQPSQDGTTPSATVTVTVVQPVGGIELKGDPITVYLEDDVTAALEDQVTITPNDATDKTYVVVEQGDADMKLSDGFAVSPGITTVKVATANGMESTKTVQVTIMIRPDNISGPDEITVNVGDNVFDAIKNVVTISSNDYSESEFIDDEMELSASGAAASLYDDNYVATTVGQMTVTVIATATTGQPNMNMLTKTITLNVKKGVSSLTATTTNIEAMIGDDVEAMIRKLVTVNPDDATNQNYSVNPDNASGNAFSDGIAMREGTWTLIAVSDDNPEATLTFTVVVKEPIALTFEPTLETTVGGETTLTIRKTAGTDNVDASKVNVVFDSNNYGAVVTATPDATGLVWTIKGLQFGSYNFTVTYDGAVQMSTDQSQAGTINISQVVAPTSGWDWITVNTLPGGSGSIILQANSNNGWVSEMNDGTNKIIEIRSQNALLYNDPTLGLFGDITELKPSDGMYKVKSEGSVVFNIGVDVNPISSADLPTTVTGYTWLGYPHQIDQPLTNLEAALASTAEEGDMILGKENFAEFSNGEWVAVDGFTFKAGKGYMYYTAGAGGKTINWGTATEVIADNNTPAPAKTLRGTIWNYDISAFADNMPIVAQLDGISNPEDYSIGAFVGDECRGEGSVAGGKYMFINVAGKSGETVSFKLYNKLTGEYTNLNAKVAYGKKTGSVSNPLSLLAGTTGIGNIAAEGDGSAISYSNGVIRVNGMPNAHVTITNAAGSVVRTSSEAVVSLDGLANGVYIVTVSNGEQRASKKILK